MRIRKKPWAQEELNNNPHIIHTPETYKGKWAEYFGNDRPIYVEIGCGKGRFIAQNAALYPEINFIGVERQSNVLAIAARKLTEQEKNIALVRADVETLEEIFAPEEIKRLYINFCDPWPKKRWAKRRLTYHGFLDQKAKSFLRRITEGCLSFLSMSFAETIGSYPILLWISIRAGMREM